MRISKASDASGARPKVVIYRSDLLPLSETFIQQQAAALVRWHPVLVGERRVNGGLSLGGLESVLLRNSNHLLGDFFYRACRLFRLPHPPTVRKLRAVEAQLVHAHFGTDAVDIWPQVHALGLPMLVTLHGFDVNIDSSWWKAGLGGKRRKRYPEQLLQLAREPGVNFIAVSDAIKERAVKLGIPVAKISVRYVGIDTRTFSPSDLPITQRAKRVLFVGRLVEKKGVAHLIRSFSKVRASINDAELVIAGEGPLRSELEKLASYLQVPAQFIGRCTSDDVRQQIHQSRLLCLPSALAANGDAEGFGMVILEAQACGVPVVTSARGGATEGILNGRTGVAFAEGDHMGLAAIIVRLLSDDELLKGMSESASGFVGSRFEIRTLTSLLEEDYDAISFRLAQRTP